MSRGERKINGTLRFDYDVYARVMTLAAETARAGSLTLTHAMVRATGR